MKFIVRTRDKKQHLMDYWVIELNEENQALSLASTDSRTRIAHSWIISPVKHEFRPCEGGWTKN